MSVLVLGANGLVGSSLVRTCLDQGVAVSGTYHTGQPAFDANLLKLDIRDAQQIRAVIEQVEPDAVVNCAAYTDVDGCEENPELSYDVNADAPGILAQECAERSIFFVHLSTDYVFDGEADESYTEDDDPKPIQVYGETKLKGEQRVLEAHSKAIVCRLSFVWGRHGATGELEGFPKWVLGQARDDKPVPLFIDQYVTPTRSGYAAEVVLELLDADVEGVFHVVSRECVTPYAFGRVVLDSANEADLRLIEEISLANVDRPASRPAYTCLSTARAATSFDWERPTLAEILSNS